MQNYRLHPDIVIQDEQSSQAYNRYSYCFNNPLRFTDPSGYVVTIPPEFEKYYMPEYLNDFDTYKKELEKPDAQNVAFNTELSEGKSVTTLTWTLGEDSYQMTIVDHGLKDYEQMCENSCVASALAAQEARFTSGNKELTENFILSLFDNLCEQDYMSTRSCHSIKNIQTFIKVYPSLTIKMATNMKTPRFFFALFLLILCLFAGTARAQV